MKKKIEVYVQHIGTSSYLAHCNGCGWSYEELNPRKGQQEIRKHVIKTGHKVTVEKNVVTVYAPDVLG